mmetsp:Transcript_341/g.1146  ORF Transcript_341/g.1146 Transcript_341/m.1146 type:complete len:279 (+) Transcript_341:129-965(+)|eukprot:CAMPEP_0198728950 /NCGR_PEP_ID=MMETSP1475-20131203/12579_1 /TAXON_ID= ORGANISM="Unidentified sp., Strain CCMP1999" /NCGR_SAMPLE_ID=MMETSP1475 /ASSEMBLY_ACC=CAM_ASM_001111 /LENGTH=278 /DNA_ID=CAMNT_0044491459 /DNA_START=128 /DNA_END=964 /DNA_ORIENTATION=+
MTCAKGGMAEVCIQSVGGQGRQCCLYEDGRVRMAAFVSSVSIGLAAHRGSRACRSRVSRLRVASDTGGGGKPPKAPGDGSEWRGEGGSGDEEDPHIVVSLWLGYEKLLERWPLKVKMVSAAVFGALSDILAQLIESDGKRCDKFRRILALSLTCAFLTSPTFHFIFDLLERIAPSVRKRNIVIQLLLDQLIAAPLYIPPFFLAFGLLEGNALSAVTEQIRRDFWPTLKLTWYVWPFVQAVNITVVPLQYRTLTIAVVDMLFTAVMSIISHKPSAVEAA